MSVLALSVCLLQAMLVDHAAASCGDWLADSDMHEATTDHRSVDHIPPCPCHGPGCRKSEPASQHLPAAPPQLTDQHACGELCITTPPCADGDREWRSADVRLPTDGFYPRVDRPPRV